MYDDDMYGGIRSRNPMASGSVALGIASLLSCTFFYISIPCGALAILCAILSRGNSKMPGKAKAGIICGLVGIAASVIIIAAAFYMVLTNPQRRAYVEQYLQLYLGDSDFSLDDTLEELLPGLINSDNSGGSDTGTGITEETEEETEKRVRLRIASDDETEADPASAPETDFPNSSVDESESYSETSSGDDASQENTEGNDDQSPIRAPQGGGIFI